MRLRVHARARRAEIRRAWLRAACFACAEDVPHGLQALGYARVEIVAGQVVEVAHAEEEYCVDCHEDGEVLVSYAHDHQDKGAVLLEPHPEVQEPKE